jgi:hypothetical protein
MKSNLFVFYAAVSSMLAMAAAVRWQSVCFNAVTNLNMIGHFPIHELEMAAPENGRRIKKLAVNLRCAWLRVLSSFQTGGREQLKIRRAGPGYSIG